MTPIEFISKIRPGADHCEVARGIPSDFTVAQGALESAWGKSLLTVQSNNLFGIKSSKDWKGPVHAMMTTEYINGKRVDKVSAEWRVYPTWTDCIMDHADFFHVNPRYAEALKFPHDSERFSVEVQKAGYATDPNYADKIIGIIRSHL